MTKPEAFITSVRVEQSAGPHEYVSVWIRGASVGTLCVGKGDGEPLARLLQGCHCSAEFLDRHGVHMFGCRMVSLGDRVAFVGAPPEWPQLSREEYERRLRELEHPRRPREWPLSAGLKTRLTECFTCRRQKCRCTNPSKCGRCHGCTEFAEARQNAIEDSWRDERPFHVDPTEPPTLIEPTGNFELTGWMRGSLEAMRVPEPEGGPDLYDEKTRTVLAHPAQKLAVAAFKRELDEEETTG